jgi:hypothetical protein
MMTSLAAILGATDKVKRLRPAASEGDGNSGGQRPSGQGDHPAGPVGNVTPPLWASVDCCLVFNVSDAAI